MDESGNACTAAPQHAVITRAQLEHSANLLGSGYVFEGASPARHEAVLAGRFNTLTLRPGLILHAAEVRDLHDMRTAHMLHHPGIKLSLLVDGQTDVAFGPRRFRFGPASSDQAARAQAMLLNLTEPTLFARRWQSGRTERKVTLTLTHEWLEGGGLAEQAGAGALQHFTRTHLDHRTWTVTPRARELARQILAPDAYLPSLHRLRLESRCIELAAEALGTLIPRPAASERMNSADQRRLVRLIEVVHDDGAIGMSMADIARAVGSNPTTIQALARRAWGSTVFERLRHIRMEKAHQLLRQGSSVALAAEAAGYASATNFAAAFRQHYGMPPRAVRLSLRTGSAAS